VAYFDGVHVQNVDLSDLQFAQHFQHLAPDPSDPHNQQPLVGQPGTTSSQQSGHPVPSSFAHLLNLHTPNID
jgi:hypothetical protein